MQVYLYLVLNLFSMVPYYTFQEELVNPSAAEATLILDE